MSLHECNRAKPETRKLLAFLKHKGRSSLSRLQSFGNELGEGLDDGQDDGPDEKIYEELVGALDEKRSDRGTNSANDLSERKTVSSDECVWSRLEHIYKSI